MTHLRSGKIALITGASSGIGEALALDFARRGIHVALVGRRADALESVAERARALGAGALVLPGDVSDRAFAESAVQRTIEAFGALDLLVHSAGISMWSRFDEVSDLDLFERIMDVNYLGAVYFTYFALPYLRTRGGDIIAISSHTGITGVPTRTGYAASKHALQGFFDSLRIELRDTSMNILVISPGFVDTPIRENILGGDGKKAGYQGRASEEPMPLDEAIRQILEAIEGRKRELVMTGRARFGRFLRLIAPGLVDRIAAKAVGDPGH